MYSIALSSRAKRALRKYRKSGRFPVAKFDRAIECLRRGEMLPSTFEDHALRGDLAGFREFHIAADLLVQYVRDETRRAITVVRVGTHTELFGE